MNKYGLYFIFNLLIVSICWGEHKIFECLKMSDYDCISFEVNINDKWFMLLDDNKRDVLDVAIDFKSQVLIKYLIGKGARVKERHIYRTLKIFLDISEVEKSRLNLKKKSIVHRLILAAVNDKDPSDTIAKLCKILCLFASEQEIALSIYQLRINNLITPRDVSLFFKEYNNLFLQDKIIDKNSLVNIVRIFLSLNVNKWLILLIVDSCEIEHRSQILAEHSVIDFDDTDFMPEKIAHAIMEQSRNFFLSLPPAAYVRKLIIKEENHDFDQLIKYGCNLDKFIISTIDYPARKIVKNLNYLTWIKIYNILLENGDFMGAFMAGAPLNSYKVKKLVSENVYRELALLNMDFNFKNYRQILQLFSAKFHIPAPMVLIRDLSSVGELNLLEKTNSGEIINSNGLSYFMKFHSDISVPYKSAIKKRFYYSEAASYLINTLIHDENVEEQEVFERAYKIMWPSTKKNCLY